ncbi:hypothetical protein M2418_002673 [Rhizobium sp. BIGb0125]|uniref:glycine-rich domain-containing protein n=1 Tax=Rhizobium sp. BIGb0125 TaxID=2940618 RepID=UPI00386C3457|nr:hypothetical protein [Rhizobium sp. BIGb0125]
MLRALGSCFILLCSPVYAQDSVPTLQPQIYQSAGDYTWLRPPEVQFVLLTFCGGGGGGGRVRPPPPSGGSSGRTNLPALSGDSSPAMTILIRVDQEKYQIRVGRGGVGDGGQNAPAKDGEDTTITLATGILRAVGGKSNVLEKEGGSTFLGSGGIKSSPNATGNCAGGYQAGPTIVRPFVPAGNGSDGYVSIFPMPDMARFARVLALLENVPPPPSPRQDTGETAPTNPTPAN